MYLFDGSDDRLVYADAPVLDALSLGEYLILAWVRPTNSGHNNGRIFGRASSVAGGPVGHMQLMVGNGQNGTRNTNFTGRQKHNEGETSAIAVSATGVVANNGWNCIGFHYGGGIPRLFDGGVLLVPASSSAPSGGQDLEAEFGIAVGNSSFGDRAYAGQIGYIAIWNVSSLTDVEINTLVSDFYGGGSGSIVVPRQDLLVEFLRLESAGNTTGDKNILSAPTVTGAVFTSANAPPISYQALGAPPAADTDNFFAFV